MKPTLNQTIRKELYRLSEQKELSIGMDLERPPEGVCMDEGSVPMDSSMKGNMHLFEGCTEPLWQSTSTNPTVTGPRPMCSSNSCTNPLYPANPNGPYACYNCGNTMYQAHVAFYQHVGSPNPGDVIHVNHTACWGPVTFCLRYVGFQQPAGTINMQILADVSSTPEPSCKECENPSGNDPSIHVWDHTECNGYGGLWVESLGGGAGPNDPVWQQHNNDLWLALGSPAVGDYNKVYPGAGRCIKYLGLIPLSTYPSMANNFGTLGLSWFATWPPDNNLYNDCKCSGSSGDERGCLDINALNYNVCCNGDPTCIVVTSDPECCRFEHEPDLEGCMDSTALNYNDCCDPNIPGCTPTISNKKCCRYDRGTEDKGCMDPSATNYNVCCNGDPNCTVVGSNPECCRYEDDPNPCKTNPKECWFCESGDINTSDWQDPMALVNANGGCIQFSSTNTTYASNYTGQMYTTQSDCTANSECKPTGGDNPCDKDPIGCWVCPEESSQQVMSTYECREITNGPTTNQTINVSVFTSGGYNWTLYPTELDCDANEECKSHGEMIECQCCNGGNPQSMSQSVPANPGCSVLEVGGLWNCQPQQSQPISCKKPIPTNTTPLSEEIKRIKELL